MLTIGIFSLVANVQLLPATLLLTTYIANVTWLNV